MKKHKFWKGVFNFTVTDSFGNIKDSWVKENSLADEGESLLLDSFFRNQNTPTNFYGRLFNDTPAETDTLADLTGEPSGNGYSAYTLNRNTTDFPTLALDSGDYKLTSKEFSCQASGGIIGAVTYLVLATSSDNSGKLVCFVSLSQERTLQDGESLNITFSIKLQ